MAARVAFFSDPLCPKTPTELVQSHGYEFPAPFTNVTVKKVSGILTPTPTPTLTLTQIDLRHLKSILRLGSNADNLLIGFRLLKGYIFPKRLRHSAPAAERSLTIGILTTLMISL